MKSVSKRKLGERVRARLPPYPKTESPVMGLEGRAWLVGVGKKRGYIMS